MRLATWNILHGKSLDDDRVDAERLRDAVAALDVDVLGVQEVDRGHPRSAHLDLAAEVATGAGVQEWRFLPALVATPGGHWRVAADVDEERTEGAYGICLLSRHPVREWHSLRLAPAPLPRGRDEPRVALAATVDTPLGVMTVATTHLSVLPGWNAVQLRRLSRWLLALPGPQILLGDLNMSARLAGLASGFQLLARHPTHPSPAPTGQIDHVLGHRPGHGLLPRVRASSAPAMPLSDHRPLVVDL